MVTAAGSFVAQPVDPYLGQLPSEARDQAIQQVMGQRVRRGPVHQPEGDGHRGGLVHEEGQHGAILSGDQHHRVLLQLLERDDVLDLHPHQRRRRGVRREQQRREEEE